ncbi:hypothetical protein KIN20_022107 [Parelaphostrongylus tenuis]|uniref:Uncharacterized protein n=1 Tax=Parelaphostrongylus tenuis TaxID=148309 RepID=A0AAD5N7P7_PARTN|nr:hypothetical protein KIN20_022107 [Parelaphostrongylus tenuis]
MITPRIIFSPGVVVVGLVNLNEATVLKEGAIDESQQDEIDSYIAHYLSAQNKSYTKITVINDYSPIAAADDHELDAFNDQLEEVIRNENHITNLLSETSMPSLGMANKNKYRSLEFELREESENGNYPAVFLSSTRFLQENSLL